MSPKFEFHPILIRFILEISILHYESNEDNNMEPVK